MHGKKDVVQVGYNDPHKHASNLRSATYGSQIFDSHKWPTVLVRTVKGKPRNL